MRQVLTSVAQNFHVNHWRVDAASSGLGSDQPWSVEKRTLHGGRQEGVDVIEVDNGRLRFTVVPTRGMSIGSLEAVNATGGGGPQSLGWASPVREYAHPALMDLQDFKGLGWLTGFNEWCAMHAHLACTPPCAHLAPRNTRGACDAASPSPATPPRKRRAATSSLSTGASVTSPHRRLRLGEP